MIPLYTMNGQALTRFFTMFFINQQQQTLFHNIHLDTV